jgi:hypothetical protein
MNQPIHDVMHENPFRQHGAGDRLNSSATLSHLPANIPSRTWRAPLLRGGELRQNLTNPKMNLVWMEQHLSELERML